MKIPAFIFMVYIVLLPCIPCMDTDECDYNDNKEITCLTSSHQNHEQEKEACNPFCGCACCAQVFMPNFQLNKIAAAPLAKQKQQFFYNNISLSSDFYGNIWQPPKFS